MRSLKVMQIIGSGAYGTVYWCRMTTSQGFEKSVALKIIHGETNSAMLLTRIRDEARLLGLLQDEAIIKVVDLLEVEGRQAVLLEYVEGEDLESIVEQAGPPPPRALAEIGAAVAGALGRAHVAVDPTTGESLNVIHRDVKPANIMVSQAGAVKLLDFGVARARFDARESFTGQLVLGTLNYMAPEYVVTGQVTSAADIYGLALSLWQGATGKVFGQPKVRKKDHEIRVQNRIAELPELMTELGPVLERMLAWEPEKRPTGVEVEELLDDSLAGLPGPGLRAWSRKTVLEVLKGREPLTDDAGLVGATIHLSDGPHADDLSEVDVAGSEITTGFDPQTEEETAGMGGPPEEKTLDVDPEEEETARHQLPPSSIPQSSDDPTEESPPSSSPAAQGSSPSPFQAPPASPPDRLQTPDPVPAPLEEPLPAASGESMAVPALTGLLIGATCGLIILIILAIFQIGDLF